MAKNDWIVAGINNPLFETQDFAQLGNLTTENTQMLSKEEYLKSDYIRNNDAFKDSQGNFSEEAFSNYYDHKLQEFYEFQNDDYYKGPALDLFDVRRTADTPVKETFFNIRQSYNPDRIQIGIEGVNVASDPVFSQREIAKQSNVFNWETQQFENYSIDDCALTESPIKWAQHIVSTPYVLATWDEEGDHIDPSTGVVLHHYKGQAKLNENGTYYYETLSGRDAWGKDQLEIGDTFTVEGSTLNKYDFFNSNDIDKSVTGTIFKAAVSLIPYFTPLSSIYVGLQVTQGLAEMVPTLYNMATYFSDDKTPEWISNIGAYASMWGTSKSDYANQHMWSMENMASLVVDVVGQLKSQMFVAKSLMKLAPSGRKVAEAEKVAEKVFQEKKVLPEWQNMQTELRMACNDMYVKPAQETAAAWENASRKLSLGWMVGMCMPETYSDLMERGLSKREAAAVTLGSAAGMYLVDWKLGLGEIFFDPNPEVGHQVAKSVREELKKAAEVFKGIEQQNKAPFAKTLERIAAATNITKKACESYMQGLKENTLGWMGKSFGEGLEEVTEEVMTDLSKEMYQLAGDFGFDTTTNDIGAFENVFDRYAMNFIGGVIGGSTFYASHVFRNGIFKSASVDTDLATLIRNGHAQKLRDQVEKLYKKGKLGSTTLSADYNEAQRLDDGTIVWATTNEESKSHNRQMYELLMRQINNIETIINNNRVNLTDDQLFENMVLSNHRYLRYKGISELTNLYQDMARLLHTTIQATNAYNNALDSKDGNIMHGEKDYDSQKVPESIEDIKDETLKPLFAAKQKAELELQAFLSPDGCLQYIRKLQFLMDPALYNRFLPVTMEDYFREQYPNAKNLEELEESEQRKFLQNWNERVRDTLKADVDKMFSKFLEGEDLVGPSLHKVADSVPAYMQVARQIDNLFSNEGEINTALRNLVEEVQNLPRLEGETDIEYSNRQQDLLNTRHNELIQTIRGILEGVNMTVDPQTLRLIKAKLGTTVSDVVRMNLERLSNTTDTKQQDIANILSSLNSDLSNQGEVLQQVREYLRLDLISKVNQAFQAVGHLQVTLADGSSLSLQEYLDSIGYGEEETVEDAITLLATNNTNLINTISNPDTRALVEGLVNNKTFDLTELTAFTDLTEESQLELFQALLPCFEYINALGLNEDITIGELARGEVNAFQYEDEIRDYALNTEENQTLIDAANDVVEQIEQNPFWKLINDIKTTVTNPVAELIKEVAAANGDDLADVEEYLAIIDNDYETIKDRSEFHLNEDQKQKIQKTLDYLQMLDAYLYAASTVVSSKHPIGHNRMLNEFMRLNKNKFTREWQELPEIDSNFSNIYRGTLNRYQYELNRWIKISDELSLDRAAIFAKTDAALNQSLFAILSRIKNVTIKVNGQDKEYNLLEGSDTIDRTLLAKDSGKFAQVPLYYLEQAVYDNFQKALKDSGYTLEEFIKQSNLIEALVPDVANIKNQQSPAFTPSLKASQLTPYTRLLYLTTLLSENPIKHYQQLQIDVKADNDIAPIAAQEFSTRVAAASSTKPFKTIFKQASKLIPNLKMPVLSNTTIIEGIAGAGKTQVTLKGVDTRLKGKPVIVGAPTATQAQSLQRAVGRTNSQTFDQILETFLGKDTFNKLKSAIANADNTNYKADGLFTLSEDKATGFVYVTLDTKLIETIKSKLPAEARRPAAIYLDEASHLSTVEAAVINNIAEQMGIQVFMLCDPAQRGFNSDNAGMSNIQDGCVFTVRTPALATSLRNNNIQKFKNTQSVRSLVNSILDLVTNASDEEFKEAWSDAKYNIQGQIPKIKLSSYAGESLAGDLVVPRLDSNITSLIAKALQDPKATIAFIGTKESAVYKDLIRGIPENRVQVLSLAEMQGQEFDYVVTDHTFTPPTSTIDALSFLQDLYTIMTRSREATVFVTSSLNNIIADPKVDAITAQAPSLSQSVAALKKIKRDMLALLKLNSRPDNSQQQQQQQPTPPTQETQPTQETPTTDTEIESVTEEEEAPQEIILTDQPTEVEEEQANAQDKFIEKQTNPNPFSVEAVKFSSNADVFDADDYPIITYTNFNCYDDNEIRTNTSGIRVTNNRGNYEGHEVTGQSWEIDPTEGDILYNAQAVATHKGSLFWAKDKLEFIKRVSQLRSFIMFDYSSQDLKRLEPKIPQFIINNFKDNDNWSNWKNGYYSVDIRYRGNEGPNAKYADIQMSNGNIARVELVLTFNVKNKQGKSCKFDIARLNNPKTLEEYVTKKNAGNLRDAIRALENAGDTKSNEYLTLKQRLDNINNIVDKYKHWVTTNVDLLMKGTEPAISIPCDKAVVRVKKNSPFNQRKKNRELTPFKTPESLDGKTEIPKDVRGLYADKVWSDIYVPLNSNGDISVINESIKGRAVRFMSDDAMLSPGELMGEYEKQINDPSTPLRVRMVMCDPMGIEFEELLHIGKTRQAASYEGANIPIANNVTGIRMFASIWNARAALHNIFNAFYNQNIDVTDAQAVEAFNKTIDNPFFRLAVAGATPEVKATTITNGSWHKNGESVNLIYADLATLQTYWEVYEELLSSMCREGDAALYENMDILTGLGIKISLNGTEIQHNEYIDLEAANHKGTFSGLLKVENGLVIVDAGSKEKINYKRGAEFALIPKIITKFVNKVRAIQNGKYAEGSPDIYHEEFSFTDRKTKKEKKFILDPEGIFDDGEYYRTGVQKNNPKDRSVIDAFTLIFHGTLEPLHTREGKNPNILQATDAYYKDGIQINPEATANVDTKSLEKIREITDSNGKVIGENYGEQQFAPTSNPLEFFQLDRDLGHTEVVVSLNGLMGYDIAPEEAIESSVEPEVIPEAPTEIQVTSEQEPIITESPTQIEANPIASLITEVSSIIGKNASLTTHLQNLSTDYESGRLTLQELADAVQQSSETYDGDWTKLYKTNRDLYNKLMEDCY